MTEKPTYAELEQMVEELRKSEKQQQIILNASGDMIMQYDTDLRIVWANKTAATVLNKSVHDIVGHQCYKIFQDRDTTCPGCPCVKALETGNVENQIMHHRAMDVVGESYWDNCAVPIKDDNGQLVGFAEIARNITHKVLAEKALLDSQHELNIRNKIANIFLTVSDEEMYGEVLQIVLEAMKSKYGIFGYIDENGDLAAPSMTRDIWDKCRISDKKIVYRREEWGGIWGRALVEKKTLFSNKPFEVPEGHLPISCAVVVPIIDHGESIGTLEVANKPKGYDEKDIQSLEMIADHIAPILNARLQRDRRERERKQAEETLRNSEKRLARAVEGNSIPTLLIDSNHIITHWNKACEKLTGISAAEIVGTQKGWSAFYAEERRLLADFIVDKATEEEIIRYYEGKYNKSNLIKGAYEGAIFLPDMGEKGKWLFVTASPLKDYHETVIGAIATIQDITERKNEQEQLRQSRKMEAIGTLAGGIAHDFNNLLTVIIGNAQLALMDVTKDESLREGIEKIKKAGEKAASLTRQLLAFSRKQVIMPEVIDLNKGINETKNMLKRTIGEDIEILTILEPELGKVYADFGQIDQVIMNLAVNARDAMPQGGKLTIETDNTDLDKNYFREHGIKEEKPGHYVMLVVSDTGIGMDKETREHIFEPFFTTKEVGKGTGLGLSTVYGIIKQNNGFVWVYSEPGQGCTFKVYLPKVRGDAEPKEKEQTLVDDPGGSETVLIVEDDYGLRKFAQEVLQSYGYRILVAENGEDALRVSDEYESPIHLLLTDVVMPRMGGKELAERLQPLYPQMKVIYMSGYTDNAIVHHGVLAPGLNFLEKPFTPEGLARKVREALDDEN